MDLKQLHPRKSLKKAFLKVKPNRTDIEMFKSNWFALLDRKNDTESEEFHKNLVSDFLKKTYYEPNHFINTKGRNDLVIHNGDKASSTVGVILEAKEGGKKLIQRNKENDRNTGSILEDAVIHMPNRSMKSVQNSLFILCFTLALLFFSKSSEAQVNERNWLDTNTMFTREEAKERFSFALKFNGGVSVTSFNKEKREYFASSVSINNEFGIALNKWNFAIGWGGVIRNRIKEGDYHARSTIASWVIICNMAKLTKPRLFF